MENIIADYALLSVAAYRDKRHEKNRIYLSTDWNALPGALGLAADGSGFEAVAYRNSRTEEIVMAKGGAPRRAVAYVFRPIDPSVITSG